MLLFYQQSGQTWAALAHDIDLIGDQPVPLTLQCDYRLLASGPQRATCVTAGDMIEIDDTLLRLTQSPAAFLLEEATALLKRRAPYSIGTHRLIKVGPEINLV